MDKSQKDVYQGYQKEAKEHERFWKKSVKGYAIASFLLFVCVVIYFIFQYIN